MNERLLQYRERMTQYWTQFNKTQKIMLVSAVLMSVLAIILLSFYFSKTEYSTAFTNLDSADASGIAAYLDSNGIPYKISSSPDGKSMIDVPAADATKVKIEGEAQGLIQNGSIGFDIFSKSENMFGFTDNEFDVVKQDALAGEIQQLINSMNGITSSKVLVTLPEEDPFVTTEDQQQALASVNVRFKPGYRPDQAQIDSIYNLVSKSVPNLPLDNINVTGPDSELLPSSKTAGNDSAGVVAQQFEVTNQFNKSIENNVKQFLGPLFGNGKFVVSVVSKLNFDKVNSQENLVTPVVNDEGIAVSVQKIQENYSGEGAPSGGVAGTGQTDVPNYPSSSSTGKTTSEKSSETINNEINRIQNTISRSPYSVKDLTINIGIEPPDPNNPASLTQETKDEVKNIMVNIVSASLADNGMAFTPEDMQNKVVIFSKAFEGKQQAETTSALSKYLMFGLGGVALALVTGGIVLAVRRKRRAAELAEEELEMAPSTRVELPSIEMDPAKNENQVRKQLETLAKKRPEEFVNLLRTWLVDE
ncbi:flagellar basal-body MS-ring/collar protein FliF [Paenibacillus gansuensis]|uniref:Flagellar M-ring protein n=1 Tax=Paenibacillus gansuensis TaxID=306542 RepID=A0ABW5PDF9_9BACL